MMPFLTTFYGNASSPHAMGQASHSALDRARDDVASVLGCSAGEVVFTGVDLKVIIWRSKVWPLPTSRRMAVHMWW